MIKYSSAFALTCALIVSLEGAAQAQSVPSPANVDDVFDSAGPTRQELELPAPVQTAPNFKIKMETGPARSQDCFASSNLRATITDVQFQNPNGGPIAPALAQILSGIDAPGRKLPVSAACDIRDAAIRALQKEGWIASIQIPQQNLINTLRLNVVAAQVKSVTIAGDPGPYRSKIEEKIRQIETLTPFNAKAAERILFSLNDIPGLKLKLALAPITGRSGDVAGRLDADFSPYAVIANVRNFNAKRTGRETLYGRAEFYGLTKMADVTHIGAKTTGDFQEQLIGQIGHEFGIGGQNTRIGADMTVSRTEPSLDGLDISADAVLLNFRVEYPIIRTPACSADLIAGLDYLDLETDLSSVALNKDALRTLYLRATMTGTGQGLTASSSLKYDVFAELRQGLDILDATQNGAGVLAMTDGVSASRPFGQADSLVARAGIDVSMPLGGVFGARLRGEGQWTDNPLLGYDEYNVGNLSIGRGYDPGANSGDRAIGAALELNANLPIDAPANIQAFGFYDVTKVENLDFGTIDPKRTLSSAGAGLRINLPRNLYAELTYAKALDRALASDVKKPPERISFSITKKFTPGSF